MELNVKQYSWTETAASTKEKLYETFPNLKDLCFVGDGVLSYLEHDKPCYQLGFVFPVKDFVTGQKKTIVYYPIKKAFVFMYKKTDSFPVSGAGEKFQTKHGEMEIVEVKGSFAVTFSRTALIAEK